MATGDKADIAGCYPCWATADAANSARYVTCEITTTVGPPATYAVAK